MRKAFWASILLVPGLMIFAGGCAGGGLYDLSTMPPFSQYAGKDVVLKRDVVLVKSDNPLGVFMASVDQPIHDMVIVSSTQPWVPAPRMTLPAGTVVHVNFTVMSRGALGPFGGGYVTNLYSSIRIDNLKERGWPSSLKTEFDHSSHPSDLASYISQFRGTIRPAPWEPLDTPATRPMPFPPDEKYLVPRAQVQSFWSSN